MPKPQNFEHTSHFKKKQNTTQLSSKEVASELYHIMDPMIVCLFWSFICWEQNSCKFCYHVIYRCNWTKDNILRSVVGTTV